MKMTMTRLAAALALAIGSTTAAQAAVYEFEGFTLTLTAAEYLLSSMSENKGAIKNEAHWNVNGQNHSNSIDSGLYRSNGHLSFGLDQGKTLTQTGAGSKATTIGAFEYSITAKDGWQIGYMMVGTDVSGSFSQTNGARTTNTLHNPQFLANSYDDLTANAASTRTLNYDTTTKKEGTWNVSQYVVAETQNRAETNSNLYDRNGDQIGWETIATLSDLTQPLTFAQGSGGARMAASGTAANQSSWISAGSGYLNFSVNAVRGTANGMSAMISPVPEPATLGMMASGLLLLGAARRRKNNASA